MHAEDIRSAKVREAAEEMVEQIALGVWNKTNKGVRHRDQEDCESEL